MFVLPSVDIVCTKNKEWRNTASIKTRVRWCVSTTETLVEYNTDQKQLGKK